MPARSVNVGHFARSSDEDAAFGRPLSQTLFGGPRSLVGPSVLNLLQSNPDSLSLFPVRDHEGYTDGARCAAASWSQRESQ
jgi:hypothetical protein